MKKLTGKQKEILLSFVIEKLVDELNAQMGETNGPLVLYDSEVEEINDAIKQLGINTKLEII